MIVSSRAAISVAMAALLIMPTWAQSPAPANSNSSPGDPLVRLLQTKGILTAAEASSIQTAATPDEQRNKLARILRDKGLISDTEFASITGSAARPLVATTGGLPGAALPAPRTAGGSSGDLGLPIAAAANASAAAATSQQKPPAAAAPAPPPGGGVVAAYAPLRVLPIDAPKREGMIPDIKLGSGARLKPYGFVKASAIWDSSSPSGTDMPLPYLNTDPGPTVAPEFHIRARNMRLGTQFEWLDISPKWTVTGRFEADFEGSFTRALNRNISTIRSSMFSLRTAWGRIDYAANAKTDWFLLVGQDWTPFGSSTLPNIVETTGLGLGFGTLYERDPQIKTGIVQTIGGSRNVKLSPEIALTLPAYGNTPANISDQLGYGERQGADSNRPEVQGRLVLQFQLDKAPNVAPAQLISSFVQGERKALIPVGNIPAPFKAAFPSGASLTSNRYGYTLEAQLPNRYFTWQGKFFSGEDLRWYFVGGLYSNFNDAAGLTQTTTVPSLDGSSNAIFGMLNGNPVIAPERPVRTRGGLTELGLPISRWFNVSPSSRAAGWSANLHYSIDTVPARDARRLAGARLKSDMSVFTLMYKMNSLVTFQAESSMYRTFSANKSSSAFGGMFTLRGVPAREWHDLRTEIGMMFTF